MEAGAGLGPAWKGEVVHPGAPGSQCVYRTRFYRVLSALSLYEVPGIIATDQQELHPATGPSA
jgi:hypothetical protein